MQKGTSTTSTMAALLQWESGGLGNVLSRMTLIIYILQTTLTPVTVPVNEEPKMPDLHSLPEGTRPSRAIRNNGPDNLVLERARLRELAEGWPCYR